MRVYQQRSVLDAAQERIRLVFERFDQVVCSLSGGKDSTLVVNLAHEIAQELGRPLHVFFLDQEAEYQATIDVIKDVMSWSDVIPHWYQVPLYMTNATSYEQAYLYAWGPDEKWMREKDELAIHHIEEEYPRRFYKFMRWFERQWSERTAFLIGLRAEESMNRLRAMIKNPGYEDIKWSTRTGDVVKFYPIYDWSFEDVFLYFHRHEIKYNRMYDFMFCKDDGAHVTRMRVSNLIHEKAFKSLRSLQEFEPTTYDALVQRLQGVHVASIYADEPTVLNARTLPDKFGTWREYRDYLMSTSPLTHRERFENRFKSQGNSERTCKQHVRQLLLNDWENNLQAVQRDDRSKEDMLKKWWDIL